MEQSHVSILGGAGHVGLAMGLVLVDAGHRVTLIDQDRSKLETIRSGELPYAEPQGEELLAAGLDAGRIETDTDVAAVADADVVVVVVGTPIDEHNNPQMDNFLTLIDEVSDHLHDEQLVVLRSTIYPGTTAIVRDAFEEEGFTVGSDLYLGFAPERVAQHHAIEEMVQLPQLIGTFDDSSYERIQSFFETFLEADCPRLTPTETEIGKLFTNMWRYITFAVANEFYLITETFADHHDVNIHRILDRTSYEYPRFDVPSPGANVGGPCLTKDGWFLIDNIPYNELLTASFQINEGMPAQIIGTMQQHRPDPDRITVLGMSFKRDSDDTRNSVAFKLKKQLRMRGYNDLVTIEPNRDGFDDWEDVAGSDWVILMTPHSDFEDLDDIRNQVGNPDCLYCDIWGLWKEMKYESKNGYFYGHEVESNHPVKVTEL